MSMRRSAADLQKQNRLTGLISIYHCMRYGIDMREDLGHWGIQNTSVQFLQTKILQEKTRLNIDILTRKKPGQKQEFEKLLVLVENALNRNIEADNLSVKKWVFLCQSIEERVKQIEALKNGRQNTGKRSIKS